MPSPRLPTFAAALLVAAASPSVALTIDDFDGPYNSLSVYYSAGPPMQQLLEASAAAAVPGGNRRLQLLADTTLGGNTFAAVNGGGELWGFAGNGQRLDFNFAYGTQTAMNLDLSAVAMLRLEVYVSTPMKLVVYASTQTSPGDDPNTSALSLDVPALFRQSLDIPLSAFVTNSTTGLPVNWADVDGLAFFASASGPIDATGDALWLQQLSAVPVPEPGSALLWVAGVATMWRQMKSRQRLG